MRKRKHLQNQYISNLWDLFEALDGEDLDKIEAEFCELIAATRASGWENVKLWVGSNDFPASYSELVLRGDRWETDQEMDARQAKALAEVQRHERERDLEEERERREYERLKKKFD